MDKNLALTCDWSGCGKPAICGLKSKDIPGLVVNVCRAHFIEMVHREPNEDEIGLGQLVMRLK